MGDIPTLDDVPAAADGLPAPPDFVSAVPEPDLPDVVPAQGIGAGAIITLLTTAFAQGDPHVKLAAVVGAGAIGVALVLHDAVVRVARNRTHAKVKDAAIEAAGRSYATHARNA